MEETLTPVTEVLPDETAAFPAPEETAPVPEENVPASEETAPVSAETVPVPEEAPPASEETAPVPEEIPPSAEPAAPQASRIAGLVKPLGRYLLFWSEGLALMVLCFFSQALLLPPSGSLLETHVTGNRVFFGVYAGVLILVCAGKYLLLKKREVPADRLTLLPWAVLMIEISLPVMTYLGAVSAGLMAAAAAAFAVLLLYLLVLRTHPNRRGIIALLMGIVMLVCLVLGIRSLVRHEAPRAFSALAELVFVYGLLLSRRPNGAKRMRWYSLFVPLVLLLAAGDLGTVWILGITLVLTAFCCPEYELKKISLWILGGVAAVYLAILWIPPLFRLVYGFWEGDPEVQTRLSHLFFTHNTDGRLGLLHTMASEKGWLRGMAAPAPYPEAALPEGAAVLPDSLYAVLLYCCGTVWPFLTAALLLLFCHTAAVQNAGRRQIVVPLLFFVQTAVHVLGTRLWLPLSGAGFPFLAQEGTVLLCEAAMLLLLTACELED